MSFKMGSETVLRLPIVDFSSNQLKPGTLEWDSAKLQVRKALETYGSFEIVYGEVPMRKEVFAAVEKLFDLPAETKSLNQPKEPFHGHELYSEMPCFESTGISDAPVLEELEKFTRLMWPQGKEVFSKTIHSFSKLMAELEQKVRRMVLDSFGTEHYYNDQKNSTKYHLKLIKYKAPKDGKEGIGIMPHTDKNLMTILYDNQVNGLEIQTKAGDWISASISPNSFIAIIGDSFFAWSNGRLSPPVHRVMLKGNEVRYSLGMFTAPKGGYMMQTPQELVDEDHPLLFKPYDYQEFLTHIYSNMVHGKATDLKEYCGVSGV